MPGQLFRVSWRNWMETVIIPVAASAAFAVFALFFLRAPAKWFYAVFFLLFAIYIWFSSNGRATRRTKIEIRRDGLSCQISATKMDIQWRDIIAAWRTTEGKQEFLHLGTNEHQVSIPLGLFPRHLATTLQGYLPPESLEEDAYKKLPRYEQWLSKRSALVHDGGKTLRTGAASIKIIGWGSLLLFGTLTVLPFVVQPPFKHLWLALIQFILWLMSLLMVLTTGPLEVDSNGATEITLVGRFRMKWEDVEVIETDRLGQTIVLRGKGKCLPLAGPGFWSGKQKAEMVEFFTAQIDERGIPTRQTGKALIRMPKNTRIRTRRHETGRSA